VVDPVGTEPHPRHARDNVTDRQLAVQVPLLWACLEEVHDDEPRALLHLPKKGEWIWDMLDHVERVGGVESIGYSGIEVVNWSFQPSPAQAPAQVLGARIVEVRELDSVPRLDQQKTVGANPAAVVEQPGPWRHEARQLSQIGQFGARHRERGEVVEVPLRRAVKAALVPARVVFIIELLLVSLESRTLIGSTEVLAQLTFLAVGIKCQGVWTNAHARHDTPATLRADSLMAMPNPRISVVVSTLGNHEGLRRVLDRFESQTAALEDFEVIVVADIADPDPAAVDTAVGQRPYPVVRITGHRPGLSANRNAALPHVRAPLVLYTDNDTLAEPQLISEHLSWHEREPDDVVGVLGHVRWAREVKVTPFMRWLDHGVQFDYPSIQGIEAGWGRFYGANVSVKKSLVERVGGFDEIRLPYLYDDLDFSYRASKVGFRLLYNRRAVVEHLREMDLGFWRDKVGRLARVEREFTSKHPEIPPYFFRMFSAAVRAPRASGRGRHVIRFVPRWVPWVGKRAWASADMYYRQQIAPTFLAAWNASGEPQHGCEPIAPYLLRHPAVRPGEDG
jgi:GT2 family glycosyltransferase